jgi:hypothetical protein
MSTASLAVLTTWKFRKAAVESREAMLDRLGDEMYGLNNQPVPGIEKERYRQTIEEIEGESAGAFRPFTQDPLFASLLLFFGGSGGPDLRSVGAVFVVENLARSTSPA